MPDGAAEPDSPILGVSLKLLSILSFVGMQTAIKATGESVPAGEVVFFRCFFALAPVLAYLAWLGDLRTAFSTADLKGHAIRGLIGVSAMGLGFFSITRLPYPEWITINYATPLITVVFAALFLGEAVRAYRWTAVAIGLVGVGVVTIPNLSVGPGALSGPEGIGIIAAIVSSIFAAIAMIQVRKLTKTEKTATIVLYFMLAATVISLLSVPFGWVVPTLSQAVLLVVAGILGGIGQLLLTAAYRFADTSTIAPFEYSSLILAILIGSLLFGEVIEVSTLLGGGIVVMAGIFIIWRESRLGLERRRDRRAGTP
ncbi:DMT family transporter [Fulvimarina sp. 2208YS6-2-32]|uniref:DMT family transporter n=1 Tax=Fulvimarina uroteuthidis TaxID=3098149 RepID=A0ABU5HX16_9HYPH|nr:DMT family transporter [Fulvimarina sp. 2208YS6-2-32]MDY8107683.1 DMT family transporter [Fulvimarina sp. 2208YS6-2-32]